MFFSLSAAIVAVSFSFPQRDGDDSFGFPDDDERLEQRQGFMDFQQNQPDRPRPSARPMFNDFPPFTAVPSTTTVSIPMQSSTPAPVTTRSPAFRQCLSSMCPTTNEYNPVCGTDNINYDNQQKLNCANFCGPRVVPNWQRKYFIIRRCFRRYWWHFRYFSYPATSYRYMQPVVILSKSLQHSNFYNFFFYQQTSIQVIKNYSQSQVFSITFLPFLVRILILWYSHNLFSSTPNWA